MITGHAGRLHLAATAIQTQSRDKLVPPGSALKATGLHGKFRDLPGFNSKERGLTRR